MNLSFPEIAEQLLKAGANPNVQDRGIGNGRCLLLTPGHDAARVGYVRTLKVTINSYILSLKTPPSIIDYYQVLLKYGADTNIQDGHGNTLAHLAAKHGQLSILKVLARGSDLSIRNLAGQTPLDYLVPEHARSENEMAFLTELKSEYIYFLTKFTSNLIWIIIIFLLSSTKTFEIPSRHSYKETLRK